MNLKVNTKKKSKPETFIHPCETEMIEEQKEEEKKGWS
jgi:hypothetical protein